MTNIKPSTVAPNNAYVRHGTPTTLRYFRHRLTRRSLVYSFSVDYYKRHLYAVLLLHHHHSGPEKMRIETSAASLVTKSPQTA